MRLRTRGCGGNLPRGISDGGKMLQHRTEKRYQFRSRGRRAIAQCPSSLNFYLHLLYTEANSVKTTEWSWTAAATIPHSNW